MIQLNFTFVFISIKWKIDLNFQNMTPHSLARLVWGERESTGNIGRPLPLLACIIPLTILLYGYPHPPF